MKAGEASQTARRVAAHRLTFERVPAPYGDPAADELLASDVAGSVSVAGSTESMVAYLAARTAFFDRVVFGALERGLRQAVIAGAIVTASGVVLLVLMESGKVGFFRTRESDYLLAWALVTVGVFVLGPKRPDPFPRVFGYHEVWHVMVVAAAVCHFIAIQSVITA